MPAAAAVIREALAARYQQGLLDGARAGIKAVAADVKTWFPGDSINTEHCSAGKALYESILALDPAQVVKEVE